MIPSQPQPTSKCPVCETVLDIQCVRYNMSSGRSYEILCTTCGDYAITEQAKLVLDQDTTNEKRYALSWIIRNLPEPQKRPIKSTDLDDLVQQGLNREPSLIGKARLLLEELRKRSNNQFGTVALFQSEREWPFIRARGATECLSIINQLELRNWLKIISQQQIRLEWEGWEQTEPLRGNAPGTVFVAMAFRPEMDGVYELGIRLAIDKCDLTPIRIDKETFSDKICEQMLTEIRRGQFVLADVTLQRPGVYFEAGYALALGKTVIWSCKEDDFENVHFDTRQYPHIVWKTPEDLAKQLTEKLAYLVAAEKRPA